MIGPEACDPGDWDDLIDEDNTDDGEDSDDNG